jgi:hypothetical protein
MLRGVLADGLDLELANWIFANPKTPDRFTAKPLSAFNYFCGDAKRELAKRKSVAPFKNAQAN